MEKYVEMLCSECNKLFKLFEKAPKISRRMSGGLCFTRVTTICPECGKEINVPQLPETEALLNERIKEAR